MNLWHKTITTIIPCCLILVYMLFSKTANAISFMITSNIHVLENIPVISHQLATPNFGIDNKLIDRRILWMLSIIRKNHLSNYYISPVFLADNGINLRILETAWPIKMNPWSKFLFISKNEIELYKQCDIKDFQREIVYVYCP